MKIKYRAWLVKGPRKSRLDTYSHFPIDMLRYDPAYIHRGGLQAILDHTEGPRPDGPDSWILLYVQIPGYKSSSMNPTIGRWASFGWQNFTRLSDSELVIPDSGLDDWVTITRFVKDEPVLMSLSEWASAKNMAAWQDLCFQKRTIREFTYDVPAKLKEGPHS